MHLGMSGKLIYNAQNNHKHDHVIFSISDNTSVVFNDPRRFGLVIALDKTNNKIF